MGLSIRWTMRAMLGLQLGLAAALLGSDFQAVLPQLRLPGPLAPALDQPVEPGDQRRRYAPAHPLFLPSRRSPGIDTTDQPSRLYFEAQGTGEIVRLSGAIAEGDAERWDEWLKERRADGHALPGRVQLHSSGGAVTEALAIGRSLRDTGIGTEVRAKDYCLSACPYILMGGEERRVSKRAQVGLHQSYFGENAILPAFLAVQDIQRSQARTLSYVSEMGVDPKVLAVAMATPPEDIYVLVEEELTEWRVATDLRP